MEYSKVKTFNLNDYTVRVHFPELSEEEKDERRNLIEKAAERFMKHAESVRTECIRKEEVKEFEKIISQPANERKIR